MICLVVGAPPAGAMDGLDTRLPGVRCVPASSATPADMAEAEALFVWDFRWHSLDALLPMLPRLRWIQTASAGVDHLIVPTVIERGIALSNAAGVFERPMAEYVLGLVLAHAKGLLQTARAQAERSWQYRETLALRGATMVVVGVGRIGREVGLLARAVGMRVIGVRREAGEDRLGLDAVVGVDNLRDVAAEADYLVLTVALTPATRGLIGREVIAALRPSAYVINVARAAVLDLAALADALGTGAIAGAALDVFENEPLPSESPLWTVPNLLVSPHMSADACGWADRVVDVFVANAERYREGRGLVTPIDVARGY
jgi:phosphoglycerate dehydrogenase-like enzyme